MQTYKVTVREGKRLVEYVISAPTASHAVESIKKQNGTPEPLVWTVWQKNKDWKENQ